MVKKLKMIAIIGIGLIGGSLGMSIKRVGMAEDILGIDLYQENIDIAIETQAITRGNIGFEDLKYADIVFLATPVVASIKILKDIAPFLKEGAIVTDVGSTKVEVVRAAEQILPPSVTFIGGHPMAGSEHIGIQGADAYLFENAVYILTPTARTDAVKLETLKAVIESIGAKVIVLEPEDHDIRVATVSHLPHLIAAVLMGTANEVDQVRSQTLALAAGGFRDTTRIAAGNPEMWRDIFLTNKAPLLEVLSIFKNRLSQWEDLLKGSMGGELLMELEKSREQRRQIPQKSKGYWPELYEVLVTVPDQPGTIAQIANILASENINIADIEILRVREGEGGTIRIGITQLEQSQRAVDLLLNRGIIAKRKA